MFKYIFRIYLLTVLLTWVVPLKVGAKEIYSEVFVDAHRCLVVEPENLSPQAPLVLMLHGLGGSANDLVSLLPELHLPACRIVFPDGLYFAPGQSSGAYAWYYPLFANNRSSIEESRDYLFKLIDRFSADSQGHSSRPVILMGFSQGGVMSLETGLNCNHPILAIVSMSGYMPEPLKTLAQPKAPLNTPILMVNGTQDNVVPISLVQQGAEALKRAGYHPVLKEFSMKHQVTQESLNSVRDFLKLVLQEYTH